jgi:hypothetical protein
MATDAGNAGTEDVKIGSELVDMVTGVADMGIDEAESENGIP